MTSSIEGSGDIELTGRADEHTLEIDGSGNFDGQDFETERARVSISGSGDVEVFVTGELDAEISGSGEIRYTGGAEGHERRLGIRLGRRGRLTSAHRRKARRAIRRAFRRRVGRRCGQRTDLRS